MRKLLRYSLALSAALTLHHAARAQTTGGVGIGTTTPAASALLDLTSTTQGLLAPRMTASQRAAIQTPAQGLLVYQTDGLQPGFWYYSGATWTFLNPTAAGDNLGNHTATQNLNLNGKVINFGTVPQQQLNLWNDEYAIGIQSSTLMFRTGSGYAWYKGGTYSVTQNDPGAGGSLYMQLNGSGNLGLGMANVQNRLDVQGEPRSGAHATGRALYVTGGFGEADTGIEFRHTNGTQGIGFGFNSLYAAGTNTNQPLNLMPKGTGGVGIGTTSPSQKLDVVGNVKISGAGNGLLFPDGTLQTTAGGTAQTLSLSGQTLSISGTGGNSVTLPAASGDNLGNHTATQNLNLAANQLVGNGGTSGLSISGGGSVGIGTTAPNAKAALEVTSTTKGLLPPRLTTAQRDAIAPTATEKGLLVFNTDTNLLNLWNGFGWVNYLADSTPTGAAPSLAPVTFTDAYTTNTYTVPAGVTRLRVDMAGGKGGGAEGGNGGRVQATLAVTPGQVLTIYPGTAGGILAQGYNSGGGSGGLANGGGSTSTQGGGGGASSDIRIGGTALANRVLVAGGGGGRSYNLSGYSAGGCGGGTTACSGAVAPYGFNSGGGGSQTSGGSPGGFGGATAGNLGVGGQGRDRSGGGGGGYYGGGGSSFDGTQYNYNGGGGGGGSSYADAILTSNVIHTQGYQAGNGYVTLTPQPAAPVLDGSNFVNVPGDNLGNHTATQNLNLGTNALVGTGSVNVGSNLNLGTNQLIGTGSVTVGNNLNLAANQLVGNGGTAGLSIGSTGNVGIGTGATAPAARLHVAGAGSTVRVDGLAGTGTRLLAADASGNLSAPSTVQVSSLAGTGTRLLAADATGTLTTPATVQSSSLAGTGTRPVVADASGTLAPAAGTSMLARLALAQTGSAPVDPPYGNTGVVRIAVTFPTAFTAPPAQVLVTIHGQNFDDTFAITTRNVTATGFEVNVLRVDGPSTGNGYNQQPYIEWLAIP